MEIRKPLLVNIVPADEAPTARDLHVLEAVAKRRYLAARHEWDRVLLRGTRRGLLDAATELETMGEAGLPLARQLTRRVAELDADKERCQRILRWCDLSASHRLGVFSEIHGKVGWVAVDALPDERAEKDTEDGRRLAMLSVAREASVIMASVTGAPVTLRLEDVPDETLDASAGRGFLWRFDPTHDFVPGPVPEEIIRWWEANRGSVSVRCDLHGEIARFDAGQSMAMLGPAWDAAVIEYHNRWERSWHSSDDPEGEEHCSVRIEPTSQPGGPSLLDAEEMWITLEGMSRPWWPYQLFSRRSRHADGSSRAVTRPEGPSEEMSEVRDFADVAAWIAAADRITVLTGAGISTESGIPDYRGPNGVWTKDPAKMRLVEIGAYVSDPEIRRQAWQERLHHPAWKAVPSADHRALANLERSGKLRAVITQNIDGLHQAAGQNPEKVIELHGTIHRCRCLECGFETPMQEQLDRVRADEADPRCVRCGGIQRSATIAFGQALDPDVHRAARLAAGRCGVFLAVGTSLKVEPAARLPRFALEAGARLVIVNAEQTPYDNLAAAVVRGSIGEVLPALVGGVR